MSNRNLRSVYGTEFGPKPVPARRASRLNAIDDNENQENQVENSPSESKAESEHLVDERVVSGTVDLHDTAKKSSQPKGNENEMNESGDQSTTAIATNQQRAVSGAVA